MLLFFLLNISTKIFLTIAEREPSKENIGEEEEEEEEKEEKTRNAKSLSEAVMNLRLAETNAVGFKECRKRKDREEEREIESEIIKRIVMLVEQY